MKSKISICTPNEQENIFTFPWYLFIPLIVTILLRYKQRASKIFSANRWSIHVLSWRRTKPRLEFAGVTPSKDRHSTSAKSKSVTTVRRTEKDHVQEQGRCNIRKNIRHRIIHRIDKTGCNRTSEINSQRMSLHPDINATDINAPATSSRECMLTIPDAARHDASQGKGKSLEISLSSGFGVKFDRNRFRPVTVSYRRLEAGATTRLQPFWFIVGATRQPDVKRAFSVDEMRRARAVRASSSYRRFVPHDCIDRGYFYDAPMPWTADPTISVSRFVNIVRRDARRDDKAMISFSLSLSCLNIAI